MHRAYQDLTDITKIQLLNIKPVTTEVRFSTQELLKCFKSGAAF